MRKKNFFAQVVILVCSVLIFVSVANAQDELSLIKEKISPEFIAEIVKDKPQFKSLEKHALELSSDKIQLIKSNDTYQCVIRLEDGASPETFKRFTNSSIPGFITAHLTLDEMIQLAQDKRIKWIYPGETFYPTNDVATGLIGADLIRNGYVNSTVYDGTGVIVLIIDTGIDYTHMDFRDPTDNTKSRILYIWDQTVTTANTPAANHGGDFSSLTYGTEYTQTQINNEIDGSPALVITEADVNGHGTHTAGSAAGNGESLTNNKYSGIAPKADIVVVKAGNGSFATTNLIDALTYAREIADLEGKPIVVNMSLGGHANAHDGTRDLDIAVDNFTGSANGRVAVISAGNEGTNSIHITGSVASGSSANILFSVPSFTANAGANNDYFLFDLWWDILANVTVTVTSPTSKTHSQTFGGSSSLNTTDGTISIYNNIDVSHTNGDTRNNIQISDAVTNVGPAAGTWTFNFLNNGGSTITYHGWLYSSSMGATLTGGDANYTVGSPGTANSAITIGSYASRWYWHADNNGNYSYGSPDYSDDISTFSSIGPRRDGVQKPDLAAPGQGIVSCLSSNVTPSASRKIDTYYILNQGTSMSCPITAGAVALLLDYNGALSASQVKTYLTGNTSTDSYTGGTLPDYYWGYGKLNIFKSLINAVNSGWTKVFDLFNYDSWGSIGYGDIGANVLLALKFSPTSNGEVTGASFHSYLDVSLTGPMYFEIWSDNSGTPGAKIGNTVSYDYQNISTFGWNYVNLLSTDVNVASGNNYYLVMYYTSGTNFQILTDPGSVDGRSFVYNGISWSAAGIDFRMRPIVSTTQSLLPVELVSFTASTNNQNVVLNWQTATEVNNYGFQVERKKGKEESSWEDIGFVEGSGNSNSLKEYSFTDVNATNGNFSYRLKQIDTDGQYSYSDIVVVTGNAQPATFELSQNYPNPFNPTTSIKYQVPDNGNVTLKIYDVLGNEVTVLVNEQKEAGIYKVGFNASELASGIYFYKLSAGNFIDVKKMILLR